MKSRVSTPHRIPSKHVSGKQRNVPRSTHTTIVRSIASVITPTISNGVNSTNSTFGRKTVSGGAPRHTKSSGYVSQTNFVRDMSSDSHSIDVPNLTGTTAASKALDMGGIQGDNGSEEQQPPPAMIREHVFLRIDLQRQVFRNRITVSFPDVTPDHIVQASQDALTKGLKGRPSCDTFQYTLLPTPEFAQTGKNWNRYEYSFAQREMIGSIDPYTLQSILLDHFVNKMNATLVASNNHSGFLLESVTHVLQFPIADHDISYNGTYTKDDV